MQTSGNLLAVIYFTNNCNDDKQFYWIKLPLWCSLFKHEAKQVKM